MTTHYGDTVDAESIMWDRDLYKRMSEGRHGMPPAFAIMSRGDAIAFSCLGYLQALEDGKELPPVSEYYSQEENAEDGIYATEVLTKVVELYNTEKDNKDE